MILRNEPGSSGIQEALKDEHVQKIVDGLLQIREKEKNLFKLIGRFLQAHSGFPSEDFTKGLEVLRDYKIRRVDLRGQRFSSSFSPNELLSSIEALYNADNEDTINYRRGAIVELLAYNLVNSRCKAGECWSNYGLNALSGEYVSPQMDVLGRLYRFPNTFCTKPRTLV